MNQVFSYFENETLYPALDVSSAVSHLSDAIRCKTVNYADHSQTDFSEFDRLQALMRQSFPAVMSHGQFELIGHAVLITVPGTDPDVRSYHTLRSMYDKPQRSSVKDSYCQPTGNTYN